MIKLTILLGLEYGVIITLKRVPSDAERKRLVTQLHGIVGVDHVRVVGPQRIEVTLISGAREKVVRGLARTVIRDESRDLIS